MIQMRIFWDFRCQSNRKNNQRYKLVGTAKRALDIAQGI